MPNILVITGGSRGIGKDTISIFMESGWQAINLSRTPCDLSGVTNLNIDLSDPDWSSKQGGSLKELVQNADKITLVHNASSFTKDDIATIDENDFRQSLEFNLVSPLTLNKLLLPYMKSGSAIVYIGSTLSEMAVAGRAAYVISKHALVGMMRVTCQDLKGKGITTCCVCPGFVNTTMLTDQGDPAILNAFIKSKVTAGRLIEPSEIAALIYFAATNPVMNGSVLHANLGQIMS